MAIGLITGLVGSIATNVFGWLERKEERKSLALKLDHQIKVMAHEGEMFKLESQAKVAETEQEAFLMNTEGTWKGLESSIADQTAATAGAHKGVKSFLALFRPILTTAFTAVTIWAALKGFDLTIMQAETTGAMTIDGVVNTYKEVAEAVKDNPALLVVYSLTEMSVTWWFGDRSIRKQVATRELRAAGGDF
jgi:hypothetical protein